MVEALAISISWLGAFIFLVRARRRARTWRPIYRIERLERDLFPEWFIGQQPRSRYRELATDTLPPETIFFQ